MSNYYSKLFRKGVECHAEDPQNCRFHKTGKYATKGQGKESVGKKDAPDLKADEVKPDKTPAAKPKRTAEEELAAIREEKKPQHGPWSYFSGVNGGWKGSREKWTPPPPPKPRTAAQIEAEIEKANPENLQAVRALGVYEAANGDHTDTRVSPLTGQAISREFNTIINALMCGLYVKDHEIEATPEWKEAQKKYSDYAASFSKGKGSVNTWSDASKEREKVRNEVYNKMSSRIITPELNPALKDGESYSVDKGFRFDIVTGLPAGGKNYTFADRLSVEHKARLADSDIVKSLLPGYADGLGANIVHDESTFINKDILDNTFRMSDPKYGDNLVYPTLGGNSSKLIDFIEQARDAGYKVHLHFNEIDKNKAKGRMLYRMISTGRFLPLNLFSITGDTVNAYKVAKEYADTAEWYKSDAGKGIDPKKIESVETDKPRRRPKSTPGSYPSYGLFGYGSYGGGGGGHESGKGKGKGKKYEEKDIDTSWSFLDEDVPNADDDFSWLDDDSFYSDPVKYQIAPSKKGKWKPSPPVETKKEKEEERSGMSIDDILKNFQKKQEAKA